MVRRLPTPVLVALACLALAASVPQGGVPGALRKAFEALNSYNYFAAREGFYKMLPKHPAAAGYGLSVIYARSDNPFTALDSALKYIDLAREAFPGLPVKTTEDYVALGVDEYALNIQLSLIDSLTFLRSIHRGSIDELQWFIDNRSSEPYRSLAIVERNALAFEDAQRANTSAAFAAFEKAYPNAIQAKEATALYHKLLFEEFTAGGRVRDFQRFIEAHPESPYRDEAEYEVYSRFTKVRNPLMVRQFIEENPSNRYVDDAWRALYALEVGDQSPRALAAFTLKYPDYPFMEELQSDFDLASIRFYAIKQEEKWGFVDEKGRVRISPAYEWTEPFEEQLALVSSGDGGTYIDKRGKPITNKVFSDGYPFKGGYAVVEIDGQQGVINRLGQWMLRPEYDACGEYSEGFFFVEKDDAFGYANRFGEIVIPLEFDYASDFVRGRAVVGKDDLYAYIDTTGKPITPFGFQWLEPFHASEVARMRIGHKFGLIGYQGDTISPAQYDALGEYAEGFYLAALGDKYGFIQSNGTVAIDFKYHFSQAALTQSMFKNGFAKVFQKVQKEVLVGVIDTTDKKMVPAMFGAIGDYGAPLTAVRKKVLWGYTDKSNNLKINYQYDLAHPFEDSLALVVKKGKHGALDLAGTVVIDFLYRDIRRIDSLFLVLDTTWHLLGPKGIEILRTPYTEVDTVDGQVLRFADKAGPLAYYNYRDRRWIWREGEAEQ